MSFRLWGRRVESWHGWLRFDLLMIENNRKTVVCIFRYLCFIAKLVPINHSYAMCIWLTWKKEFDEMIFLWFVQNRLTILVIMINLGPRTILKLKMYIRRITKAKRLRAKKIRAMLKLSSVRMKYGWSILKSGSLFQFARIDEGGDKPPFCRTARIASSELKAHLGSLAYSTGPEGVVLLLEGVVR